MEKLKNCKKQLCEETVKMIINPNTKFDKLSNSVFLAGACSDTDWRDDVIKYFNELGFTGDIIDPRNDNYDGCYACCNVFHYDKTPEEKAAGRTEAS